LWIDHIIPDTSTERKRVIIGNIRIVRTGKNLSWVRKNFENCTNNIYLEDVYENQPKFTEEQMFDEKEKIDLQSLIKKGILQVGDKIQLRVPGEHTFATLCEDGNLQDLKEYKWSSFGQWCSFYQKKKNGAVTGSTKLIWVERYQMSLYLMKKRLKGPKN
jgi:hypothetical protein